MKNCLLGIDSGGTMVKAALFDLAGRELAVASRKTQMLTPAPGHTERDVDELWQATAGAIREVVARAAVEPASIACVATTGHGNGLYLVDAQGRATRPGIISTDTRAAQYVARWQAEGIAAAVHPRTLQTLWPGQPGALLAWLRDHEPETLRRSAAALMVKDLLRLRLTGQLGGELTDMSGVGLMDLKRGSYDDATLECFGLAPFARLLPPLVASEKVIAPVTPAAAAATGLAEGTPVAGGLFDVDACAVATGVVDSQPISIVAGTWSVNQYITPQPPVDPSLFLICRYPVPGQFLVMEASASSASNLEWFVTHWLAGRATGAAAYDLCNQWVAATGAEESEVVFLPFLYGAPGSPSATASLQGLAAWHEPRHVVRAVYEGIVFGHRWHVERLLKHRPPPSSIRLTGGAARSMVWSQMFADVLQTPVEVPAGTELGALGAAICAAVAAGLYPDFPSAVASMVRMERTYAPDPGKAEVYERKYEKWRRSCSKVQGSR